MDAIFNGFSDGDDDFYDEIEETLVMGDIGINATTAIIDNLKQKVKEQHIKDPHECKGAADQQYQGADAGRGRPHMSLNTEPLWYW